ncbi:MAG TPA: hypothetical protein VFA43_01520 [Gemmatimonadaceae bacterium]|nr:hypothetical protein [Gemmatimonadaceae bacterium]
MFRRVLPLVVSCLVVVACTKEPRPTPAPPFAGKPIASVSNSDVIAYAKTLQFDSTGPGADTITINTPTGDTIRLSAAPEVGAAALSDSAVAAGRIIARVHSSAPFSPLGASAGTTYFWVQGAGENARGAMIPEDSLSRRYDRPLLLRKHGESHIATSRFLSFDVEGMHIFLINTRCDSWCCSFTSDFVSGSLPQVDSALSAMHSKLDAAK